MKSILKLLCLLCGGMTLVSCTSQTPATVVDNKHNFYSRGGAANKYVVVGRGQTLGSIARKYGVSEAEIIRLNRIDTQKGIAPGMTLAMPMGTEERMKVKTESKTTGYQPIYSDKSGTKESNMGYLYSKKTIITERSVAGGQADQRESDVIDGENGVITEQPLSELQPIAPITIKPQSSKPALSPIEADRANEIEQEEEKLASSTQQQVDITEGYKLATPLGLDKFEWPINGKILMRYGKQGKKFNDGINIAAPVGTPVRAASDGKVVYIGNDIEGYGNLLILRHGDDIMTAYAHLDSISVERGIEVKKGDTIGKVGSTGNVSQPQLHFSIRQGKKNIDPEGRV